MERYPGTSIAEKSAIGKIHFYKTQRERAFRERDAVNAADETARFDAACAKAQSEMEALCAQTEERIGAKEAAIFRAHRMLLRDPTYQEYVRTVIREQAVDAEYAVMKAREYFMRLLLDTEDALIAERAADVADVSEQLLRLLGEETEGEGPAEPVILVADDILPGELMRMERSGILALVLRHGSLTSHTAILARSMDLPALVGVDVREDWDGRTAVVDGAAGALILDPDEACLQRIRAGQDREEADGDAREEDGSKPYGKETGRSRPHSGGSGERKGRTVRLYANITGISEVDAALANGAEGIGLLRSEFLYLAGDDWPGEEEQFAAYRTVAAAMGGRPVVIRTLDAGADKQAPYMRLQEPFGQTCAADTAGGTDAADAAHAGSPYGNRGIRVCLERPEMFRTQLRAILRAGAYGTVAVMFPMITSLEEVRQAKAQLALAREEIASADRGSEVPVGIMIETPEAVAISDRLAREVDFFSVGTNDLEAYLLGRDRREAVAGMGDGSPDPILAEALCTVIANGHAAGIPVGICGELAADTTLTETLVNRGIDVLSVAPGAMGKVREELKGF